MQLVSRIQEKSINKIFKYLLENYNFKDVSYILSDLVNEENIWYVIDKYKQGKDFDKSEIEYFRNYVSNKDKRTIARLFNDELAKIGFKFNSPMFSDDEILKNQKDFDSKPQKNFDILFERDILLGEIKAIFNENSQQISKERYYEIQLQWYTKNGHGNIIDTSLEILSRLIHRINRPIEYSDVEEYFDEDFIFQEIKYDLENKRTSNKIEISDDQKELIEKWILKKITQVNFSKIFESFLDDYTLLSDYKKWEDIIYFTRLLGLELPQDFLLNSLIVPEVRSYDEDKSLFNYLEECIIDKQSFDSKIEENLKFENLPMFVLDKHIDYAIDKNLESSFSDVRRHLMNARREYNMKKKLHDFYKATRDVSLLKNCSDDLNSFKTWDAISILMEEKVEQIFCTDKAIEYLEKIDDVSMNNRFVSNSLNVLFEVNSLEAVKYYYNFLSIDFFASASSNFFTDYNAIEDYYVLEDFFNKIYLDKRFERSFNNSANFLEQYISNLSKNDESYKKTISILLEIRDKLTKENNDIGIFHINLLIDTSNNTYYNMKSEPLTFNDALLKVNEIIS